MNTSMALKVLDIVLLGITLAPEARHAAERLAETLRRLDGNDPTDAQWAAIDAETDALIAGLRHRTEAARSGG